LAFKGNRKGKKGEGEGRWTFVRNNVTRSQIWKGKKKAKSEKRGDVSLNLFGEKAGGVYNHPGEKGRRERAFVHTSRKNGG